ncbi:3'(2'),5'-bisphosphate nucleotidase CysQ [Leptolyngbya sp. FACHB-261]|uniref:3'(2'),5'-bisphosphate nucleotidase CysQ family protein n=1 Tax=Leptolyngbya sp. FACHB-261 TaxID=2692806 RepID=UPI00168717B0|nr:inositol monophosphatase family protein [Leptolyngbya sp. FACHB-261]MBD2103485.1 inositol monophosphatase family protein [Leptolyngbya sp. FACHB-261]
MDYFSPEQDGKLRALIRSMGQQAESMTRASFQVIQKGPEDYVTDIDRALDRELTQRFRQWFPDDGLVTEENPDSRAAYASGYDRTWFIDPLDGTDSFIQGTGDYAVMVGLLRQNLPVGGWVYSPSADILHFGGPGWGLYSMQGDAAPKPVPTMLPPQLSADCCPIMIGYRDQRQHGAAITEAIPEAQFYSLGSFGLKVIEVIRGKVGLYLYLNGRVKLWDTTGPIALARAAGLMCCDLWGRPLRFTPDAVDPITLAHHQTILVGWRPYMEALQPRLLRALEGQVTQE